MLPAPGDVVVEAGHSFEVAELDGRRVSRVRVTRVASQEEGHEEEHQEEVDLGNRLFPLTHHHVRKYALQ